MHTLSTLAKTPLGRVDGTCIALRLVDEGDADFIHGLRLAPKYNAHLSTVTGTAKDQRAWITRYKSREADRVEFYYVIERPDGVPCGVVRLYDIGQTEFTWGSWILNDQKPRMAALESALLSFGVGFECLGLNRALLDARLENHHAIAFYRRFGMVEIGQDSENQYFEFSRDSFRNSFYDYTEIIAEHIEI